VWLVAIKPFTSTPRIPPGRRATARVPESLPVASPHALAYVVNRDSNCYATVTIPLCRTLTRIM
jgi:hypothetical protein